jgi:autotransporter-associated beta strand protein
MTSEKTVRWVAAAIISFVNTAYMATTNTWDADVGTTGAQDGSGTWTSSLSSSNWWSNAAVSTNWDNSAIPDLTIIGAGSGAAGAITLGEPVTVGHLRFNVAGSGNYTLEGNGNPLTFGMNFPLLWVSAGVTVTNRISSDNNTRDLELSGGGTIVFAGTNVFHSVDIMDSSAGWHGLTGGVDATTMTIPAGASFRTTGSNPVTDYDGIFGFRLRRGTTLNIAGNFVTTARLGGHSGEENSTININPGAVVTNTLDTMLGWNSKVTLNINGGAASLSTVAHRDGGSSYFNLNGGVLDTTHVSIDAEPGGKFYITFNGGLLRARSNYLLTENSDKGSISTYQVGDGGAIIDNNGNNLDAVVPFTKAGSGGLTKQGSGTLTYAGGSYTGATTVTSGTLSLGFSKRTAWVARDAISEFYERSSKLVLNGGNFVVTGRETVPSVTKNFTLGPATGSSTSPCARSGNTTGLVAGMTVSGTLVPADTYIAYVKDSSRLMLSKNTTNTTLATAQPLTFGGLTNVTWQTIDAIELQQSSTLTVNATNGPSTVLSVGSITGPGGLTKDGNGTLALYGASAYGGATLIKDGTVKLIAPVIVTNASFEAHETLLGDSKHPEYGIFGACPTNAVWTFQNSAGIAALSSTWVNAKASIDGAYAAFLQAWKTNGVASTTFSVPANGQYILSFMAGKRPNTLACPLSVEIDGVAKGGFVAADFNEIGAMYTVSAVLSGGSHALTFRGLYVGGDDVSIWIDRVTIATLEDGSPVGSLPAGAVVGVASNAVLNLGGGAQTLAQLSGYGLVTNGTLSVTNRIAPGGTNAVGTLTLATATALTGTLLVDTTLAGTNDLLKVRGTLNLPAGATLQIQDVAQLKRGTSYVIATCTPGGLTGRFESSNLAIGSRWHVVYDTGKGEVRLEVARGTVIQLN